ncbi:uncharacterized protein PHALS_15168 [Plasmopara halstedii]|uniref:Uncharacterized protein n=1 Tax=Plasmopara halstedii TaxID=4781 RepID=A0A0P1B503_PLAHL|nr:uncharacterized protein PHALS_15168 [Plasmopara halstedii]CEG48719.1 hypothetical protein PHALS_15168 [Plasmopara halstedii]|eukprot:XP_024585088.1 hypothetical protein PHALS_15168 [Plasmopara halstedii]
MHLISLRRLATATLSVGTRQPLSPKVQKSSHNFAFNSNSSINASPRHNSEKFGESASLRMIQ